MSDPVPLLVALAVSLAVSTMFSVVAYSKGRRDAAELRAHTDAIIARVMERAVHGKQPTQTEKVSQEETPRTNT